MYAEIMYHPKPPPREKTMTYPFKKEKQVHKLQKDLFNFIVKYYDSGKDKKRQWMNALKRQLLKEATPYFSLASLIEGWLKIYSMLSSCAVDPKESKGTGL